MSNDKDIRFSEKKIDENWKEQAAADKMKQAPPPKSSSSDPKRTPSAAVTSRPFLNLLSSLGYQAMVHLGEVPSPETGQREANLEAAREVIDLLTTIKAKTEGNLSAEESEFFQSILPGLQMKFAEKV